MHKRFRYILLLIILLAGAHGAFAQSTVPDEVCVGTSRMYGVKGNPESVYAWKIDGVLQNSTVDSLKVVWTTVGNHVVEVQEYRKGCWGDIQSERVKVTDQLTAAVSIKEDLNHLCPGMKVTLTAVPVNGGANPHYRWKVNGIQAGPDKEVFSYTPSDGDKVSVEMTPNAECVSGDVVISNVVNLRVSQMVITAPKIVYDPVNHKGSIDITVSGGSVPGNYLFSWSNGATTEDIANLSEGTYLVTVIDRLTNCSVQEAFKIAYEAAPITASVNSTSLTCYESGDGKIEISNEAGGSGEYQYSINDGRTWEDTNVYYNRSAGGYKVLIRDKNNPSTVVAYPVQVSQPGPLILMARVTKQPGCSSSGEITIDTPRGAGYSYSADGKTYQSGNLFAGLLPGTYPVTVKNGNECVSAPLILTIVQSAESVDPPVVSNILHPQCINDKGSFTVTAPLGPEYTYSVDGINYQVSITFNGLIPGTYSLTARRGNTCVSSPVEVVINTPPVMNPPVIQSIVQPTCDSPTGMIRVSIPVPSDGLAYVLRGISPAADPVTNTTGLFENLTPGGRYGVAVINPATGCVSAETVSQINALPAHPAAPVLQVSVSPTCNNPDGTVMVVSPRGPDFQYSMDGGRFQGSAIFAGLRLGDHTVRVRNVKTGCVSEEAVIAVPAIPPPPVITAKEDPAICFGGTGFIEFSITNIKAGNHIIRHDKGQFQVILNADGTGKVVAPVGKYKNLTMEVGGCNSYNPDRVVNVEVTQPEEIVVKETIISINPTTNEKATIILNVTGGNGNYTYRWDNGETTQNRTNLDAGYYKVRVSDQYNCYKDTTIEVPLPTLPHAFDDSFTAMCNVISGNVVLNDVDKENDRLFISETSVLYPKHGTLKLSPDGTFEYRADLYYSGLDSFKYALFDKNKYPGIYGTVVLEVLPDKDRDGVTDAKDKDTDGDGLLNALDGYEDADGDGLPNYLDIDSDGDGILDHYEVQQQGRYVKPASLDVNKNGVDDAYDNFQMTRELIPADSDLDNIPDYLDLDSDNDLVPDFIEGHDKNADGSPDQVALGTDADGDGLDDGYDSYFLECDPQGNFLGSYADMQDFEGDGLPDYRDDNDDGDEYLTKYEDMDGNGDLSNDDFDYDGNPEYLDHGRACELFVPDAFSPNGDDIHDTYMIYCINHFPNAKIYIFDQMGNKLYEKANYGNLEKWESNKDAWWDGTPDRGAGRGKRVPPGTYYYVLDLGNGEVKKSFVFVSY